MQRYAILSTALLAIITTTATSQNTILGQEGFFNIPSAYFHEDGEVRIFFNGFEQTTLGWDTTSTWGSTQGGSFTFLPGLEFSMSSTLYHGENIGPDALGDRQGSFKVRILKERTYMPQIALGINDFISVLAAHYGAKTIYFNSLYLTAGKKITLSHNLSLETDVGYGRSITRWSSHSDQLQGLFGMSRLRWNPTNWLEPQLILGLSDKAIVGGASLELFNHGTIWIAGKEFRTISGGVALYGSFSPKKSAR